MKVLFIMFLLLMGCQSESEPAKTNPPDVLKTQIDTLNQAKQLDKNAKASAQQQADIIHTEQ